MFTDSRFFSCVHFMVSNVMTVSLFFLISGAKIQRYVEVTLPSKNFFVKNM